MMMGNFHKLSDESLFSSEQIPLSYSTGNKCAHIFQSQLHITMNNAVHLLGLKIGDCESLSTIKQITLFLEKLIFHNPIWDMGLQFLLLQCFPEEAQRFECDDSEYSTWTSICVCPCSKHFDSWHTSNDLNHTHSFEACEDVIFRNPLKFIKHIQEKHQNCIYHYMILCTLKTNFSWLFQCQDLHIQTDDLIKQHFG